VPVHGESYVAETPIVSITFVGRLSVGFFANRVGAELKMRWFVRVCARLAIAATWTSSAAALDAQVERGKYLSSANSLWEPLMLDSSELMLDSSESVNRVVRRYDVPSRDLRDNSSTTYEKRAQTPRLDFVDVNLPPAAMPTVVPTDHTIIALWSVFTSFMEGFASYCAMLHLPATFAAESCPTEATAGHPEKISARKRRRSIAVVSSSTSPGATGSELERDINRTAPGFPALSGQAGFAGFCGSPPFDIDGSNHEHWLTEPWSEIASRRTHRHREREIEKAVAALAQLDDRTLRDIGIPHRSQIEQVVRYCRDC
jgi:uncharacterized protein YjiS (DUF1127 family)